MTTFPESPNGHTAVIEPPEADATRQRIRITDQALAVLRILAAHPADTQADILREAARILGVPLATGDAPARTTEESH